MSDTFEHVALDAFTQLIVEKLGRGLEPHEAQEVRRSHEQLGGRFHNAAQFAATVADGFDDIAKAAAYNCQAAGTPPVGSAQFIEALGAALIPKVLGAFGTFDRIAGAHEQSAAQGDAMLGLLDRFVRAHESLAASAARVALLVPKCSDEHASKFLPFFALASASKPTKPEDKRYEHRVGMLAQNLRDSFGYWSLTKEQQAHVKEEAAKAKAAAATSSEAAGKPAC